MNEPLCDLQESSHCPAIRHGESLFSYVGQALGAFPIPRRWVSQDMNPTSGPVVSGLDSGHGVQ